MPANVLSADNATFDTSVGDWVVTGGSRVTTPTPHAGSHALALVAASDFGHLPLGITPGFPGGHLVTASMWVRQAGSGTARWAVNIRTETFGAFTGVSDFVPTTSWQRLGKAFVIGGPGTDTVRLGIGASNVGAPGDVGYHSDVLIGSEAVNPPAGLTVIDSGGDAQLNWAFGADQYSGFLDHPTIPQTLVRLQCRTVVERSRAGAAFAELTTVSGSTTMYTDTTAVIGDAYRLRQAVYRDTAGTGAIMGYSAYTATVVYGAAVGGWGAGMVRMGSN